MFINIFVCSAPAASYAYGLECDVRECEDGGGIVNQSGGS